MKAEHDNDGDRPLARIVSLRPCPFCGGEAKLVWSGGYRYTGCIECGVSGNDADAGVAGFEQLDASAAAKWNIRADDARLNWIAGGLRDNVSRLEDVVWDIEQLENWKTDMRLLGIHEVVSQALASAKALLEQANAK